MMSDIAVCISEAFMKSMEENVQQFIVAAVLEHGLIVAFSGTKPCKIRSRAFSLARDLGYPVDPQHALNVLLNE
ncbi:hypothetical protein MTO96_025095, partial [Rhipicephalus appendiculatus]